MFTKKTIHSCLLVMAAGIAIATPLVVVACSSNNVQSTNSTSFANEYNINQQTNIKDLLPSEAKQFFINNPTALKQLVLDNIITGHKVGITIDQVTTNASTSIANDDNGTLSLTYVINRYWIKNTIVDDEPKTLTVILNGFKTVTVPTDFKDSKTVTVTDTNLAAYNVDQIVKNQALLLEWIFANEISGNKQNLSSNTISLTIIYTNKVDGKLTANYTLKNYWSNRGFVNTASKQYMISLNGFIKTSQTDEEILANINPGGTFHDVQIDNYRLIIAALDITATTRFDQINQTFLDQIKRIPDFANLSLSIVSGNQTDGTLGLKLTGKYLNVDIPANQSLINIAGFKKIAFEYNIASSMWINVAKLNADKYYADLQTKQTMTTWSDDLWINYLSEYAASGAGVVLDLLSGINNGTISNPRFNNASEAITQNNWTLFSFSFEFINYRYNNNAWVQDNTQSYTYRMDKNKPITYLTDEDALNYIIKNHVNLKPEETAGKYASFWYAQTIDSPEAINSFLEITPVYVKTYFADRVIIEFIEHSMSVNDWEGSFSFSYKLTLPDDLSSPFNQASMEVTNALKLSAYVADKIQQPSDNAALIKNNDPASSMVKRIIKSVQTEFSNDALNALAVNEQKVMVNKPEWFRVGPSSYTLFNANQDINDKFDSNLVDITANFLLLSKPLNGTLNSSTNIFDRRTNGGFYLDSLRAQFDSNDKATLTKINNQTFQYKVPFVYELSVLGHDESIPAFYFYNLTLSELGYS